MQIILAVTESHREQSRTLINLIFPLHQHILRKDRELITLEERDQIFKDKDLIILCEDTKILGTALLEVAEDAAYVTHLTRHPDLPKEEGYGKQLMAFAENRAKDIHRKQKMRVSTVYHPECRQQGLVAWYAEELEYLPWKKRLPDEKNKRFWECFEPQYRNEAYYQYFEKNLT